MAYDKMVDSAVLDSGLAQVADAIRARGETSGKLAFPGGMTSAIAAIPKNFKRFSYASSAAVAAQWVKVVTGDPDVAAHWSDESAVCIVRKVTNLETNGLSMVAAGNLFLNTGKYGAYMNLYISGSTKTTNTLHIAHPLTTTAAAGTEVMLRCTSSGDIEVACVRQQNNFGGAEYIIEFLW